MESTEEQKKNQAINLVCELFQHGINRGAYSSVEINAFNHAINVIKTPIAIKQEEVFPDKAPE